MSYSPAYQAYLDALQAYRDAAAAYNAAHRVSRKSRKGADQAATRIALCAMTAARGRLEDANRTLVGPRVNAPSLKLRLF